MSSRRKTGAAPPSPAPAPPAPPPPAPTSRYKFKPCEGDAAELAATRRAKLAVPAPAAGLFNRASRALNRFWMWQATCSGLYMLDFWEQFVCAVSFVAISFGVGYGLRVACARAAAAFADAVAAGPPWQRFYSS